MGKYKKYAKIEQNLNQSNKFSSNNYSDNDYNQNSKMTNKKRENNNKNEFHNLTNGKYSKKDENSFSVILFEIFDAIKYFFIMCKNYIIPRGITCKVFICFLILEIFFQGIIIYIIKSVLFTLNKYFSISTSFSNMYIYNISYIQMIYIFICEGLLVFRFIHIKIYIFKKVNWLINVLTCIIIIINTIEISELNYKVYRFNLQNNEFFLYSNDNNNQIVNKYINLYVNKNEDFEKYELCYEMKSNSFNKDKNKKKILNLNWVFDEHLNLYIGCKNLSLSNKPHLFFNCKNKVDANNAPNYCVSSAYRRKRFYSHLKIAIFEVIILFLWNVYNYFSIELIYHYYPFLKNNNKSSNQNDCIKKNNIDYNNYNNNQNIYNKKNITNQTITYKDINDKEVYEDEYEEEDEYEDEEEENINNKEDYQSESNVRQFKRRKISKRKMKTYKKKRKKNKYKEEIKNRNKYFDEEILNKDYFDNNEDNNDDDSSDKNDEEDEECFKTPKNNFKNKVSNKDEKKDESDDDDDEEEEEDDEEEDDDEDDQDFITKRDKIEELRKIYLKNIRNYQYFQKFYNFLFGNYINWIKNKFHQTLIDIDKNISEDE